MDLLAEHVSLVGMAVSKDLFREDAHAVMRFMQAMQVCLVDAACLVSAYPARGRRLLKACISLVGCRQGPLSGGHAVMHFMEAMQVCLVQEV